MNIHELQVMNSDERYDRFRINFKVLQLFGIVIGFFLWTGSPEEDKKPQKSYEQHRWKNFEGHILNLQYLILNDDELRQSLRPMS